MRPDPLTHTAGARARHCAGRGPDCHRRASSPGVLLNFPKPDPPDLKAAFQALSPEARLTALLCGVVSPLAYEPRQLARMLRSAEVRLERRPLTVAAVENACDGLKRRRLLSEYGFTSQVMAVPDWAPWLTLEARRQDLLERLWAACEKEHPSYYPHYWERPSKRELAELRYATVAGHFELVPDQVAPQSWWFLAQPGAAELLATLPEQHRDAALAASLNAVINYAAFPDPIVAACRELAPGSNLVRFAADIALIRILQGRLDVAETIFRELPAPLQDAQLIRIDRAGVRALVATLRGDDDLALRSIEEAIAAQKEGTRKRAVFPQSAAFALSLLSLVRSDTPATRSLLAGLLTTARRLRIAPSIVDTVAYAAELRAGYSPQREIEIQPHLGALLDGWAYCWGQPARLYLPPAAPAAFSSYVERLTAHGFAWLLAECLAIIGCAGAELAARGGRSFLAAGRQATAMHRQLGTQTLTTAVPATVPEWEFSLKALEQFAFETRKRSKPAVKRPVSGGGRRLVWDFATAGSQVTLTPREQRSSRNGTWSKGRPRSLHWLASAAETEELPQAQDRAAAALLKQHGARVGRYFPPAPLLFELAGHPHVFNQAGDTVEVVRSEPELVIEQHAGGVRADVVPDDWDEEHFYVRQADARRCEVMRFTPAHRRLREIIPPGGLELPASARPRLLEAVSALVSEVRVHGGVEGGARSARRIEADPEPRVRLEPFRTGLTAELVVEPVAGSETWFGPGAGGTLVFGQQDGETVQAQRNLAAERAAAARLVAACPQLAGIGPGKWAAELSDPAAALELLEQLEAAGARSLWPQGERFKIVARAATAQLKLQIKTAADWLLASGELRIDQQRALDLKQLFALLDANPGSRFLELGEGQFLSLTESFRRQLDDLRSVSSPAAHGAVRLPPVAALVLDEFVAQTRLDADREWRALRRRLREAEQFEPEVPSTLQAELRPYQQAGFTWLARLSRWGAGACLADDMGLGKTVQVLALLLERAPAGAALVVVPTSVVANWLDEARRFAPTLNALAYVGPGRSSMLDDPGPFDLIITTYALLHRDAEQLGAVAWHSAVLDEAQAIKNPATKRARAARALAARFRLVTTGTPVQNAVTDLYSLFSFINPGLLGSLEQFRRNFATSIEERRDDAAWARLRRLVAPFILRRLKTEVLDDLPSRTEITLHVEMSPAEAAFYEALRRRAVEDLQSLAADAAGAGRLEILAHLTRLRRACCNPALVHPSAAPPSSKLAVFGETLAELLASRHKVLVFSQFVGHLKLIEAYLREAGISYQYLDGATSLAARRQRIAAFQAGQGDVFLISLTAGGVGLNLTAADYVIHMDPWWNPAVEDQASDRAHRIGQTRPVTIYRLVTKGTIEEQIVDLHHRKRDLAERLLEAGDAPARLDPSELLALLRQPLA